MARDDQQATPKPTSSDKTFSAEERAAMRQRAKELKAEASRMEGERDLLTAITAMSASDRVMAERLHAIITASAPALAPKTWYGMPAYATSEGKIVCFFQPAEKFKTRYATLGFNDSAHLDDGAIWPVAYALKELTTADEAMIATLVKKAIG